MKLIKDGLKLSSPVKVGDADASRLAAILMQRPSAQKNEKILTLLAHSKLIEQMDPKERSAILMEILPFPCSPEIKAKLIAKFVKAGIDVQARNSSGQTPFMALCQAYCRDEEICSKKTFLPYSVKRLILTLWIIRGALFYTRQL